MDLAEFVDKDVHYAHRIGIRDVIVEAFGKQGALASVFTLNKPLHGRSLDSSEPFVVGSAAGFAPWQIPLRNR